MRKEGIITFNSSLKTEMLDVFGMIPDKDGYLVDKETPYNTIDDKDGNSIHIDEFAGINRGKHGEVIVIKSDIVSMIELSNDLKED